MKYVLPLLVLIFGCAKTSDSPPVADANAQASAPTTQLSFDGDLEATNATPLRVPSADIFLGKYQRKRGWQRIKFLAPEGKQVKKGDMILRFEFTAKAALPDIKNEIKQIKAELEKTRLAQLSDLRSLESARGQLDLTLKAAKLDTQRQSVVSKRAQALFEFDHRIAQFDAQAVRQRIKAHQVSMKSSAEWYAQRLNTAENVLKKYNVYKKRYVQKAPTMATSAMESIRGGGGA